jgi:hypothetical protein
MGGHAHETCLRVAGSDGFADLDGKFNALAVHLQLLDSPALPWSVIGEQRMMIVPQRRSSRLFNIAQFLENGCPRPVAFSASVLARVGP